MNSGLVSGHSCQICGAESLREFESFPSLPRVTSDANPWPAGGRLCVCLDCGGTQKVDDSRWRDEIAEIYKRYQIYHQSCGAEQPIFAAQAAAPQPRSALIAKYIEGAVALNEDAFVLDFGCGNGSALRTFAQLHPQWRLYGHELSDSGRSELQKIDNFVDLFTCDPKEIDERFDLITLIHSLEHVIDPGRVLTDLLGLTRPKGFIVVEVPDCAATPYDLLIADHLTHFTLETLCHLVSRVGIATVFASNTVLPKELSWIGTRAEAPVAVAPLSSSDVAVTRIEHYLSWLQAQATSAKKIATSDVKFGIFGTSISGTWLAGVVGEGLDFFVDEDAGRVGREHMGRPILAPDQVARGSEVYVPLIPKVSQAVARRLQRPGVVYHTPPDLAA